MRESGLKMAPAMTYQVTEQRHFKEKSVSGERTRCRSSVTHRNDERCAILVFAFPAGFDVRAESNVKNSWHKARKNYN
jgi:hypothetical protein